MLILKCLDTSVEEFSRDITEQICAFFLVIFVIMCCCTSLFPMFYLLQSTKGWVSLQEWIDLEEFHRECKCFLCQKINNRKKKKLRLPFD